MRVIINADDFGYSHEINIAIQKAIEEKKISSTTIMANAPFYEEAVEIAKKFNGVSYGVHLNIIEFKPLTNGVVFSKYNLIDNDGCFIEGAVFCIKDFPEELKRAIKEEWTAQVLKVRKSGIDISHIDSHQHVHAIPALQSILIELMEELDIQKCRRRGFLSVSKIIRSKNYSYPKYNKKKARVPKKSNALRKLFNHFFLLPLRQRVWVKKMKRRAKITDGLFSYQFFIQDARYQKGRLEGKCIELECHPGLIYNIEETEMLMADMLSRVVSGYELISYNDL